MFPQPSPDAGETVVSAGHADAMADLFAIIGFAAVSLLCVARWWEEH